MAMNGGLARLRIVVVFDSDISQAWNSLNCSMRQKISAGCMVT